jgi:hypothetical protein
MWSIKRDGMNLKKNNNNIMSKNTNFIRELPPKKY